MEAVNYIKQLNEVMSRFSEDNRLNSTHVSLYLALFLFWNLNRFKNPISISRSEVMRVSKIGSNATYHRCITDLNKWKYLEYLPSYNPLKGSLVNMFIFETSTKQEANRNHPKNEQVPEQVVKQALVPYINSIKHNKEYKQYKTIEGSEKKSPPPPPKNSKSKSPSSKKRFTPPKIDEVKAYFNEKKSTSKQADMFFNHFESNGWMVGGRAKMKNWKAAARNWISRSHDFQKERDPTLARLNVNQSKDYDIPL